MRAQHLHPSSIAPERLPAPCRNPRTNGGAVHRRDRRSLARSPPDIASAAPIRSVRVGACPSISKATPAKQRCRSRRTPHTLVRQTPSPPGQGKGEGNKDHHAERNHQRRRATSKRHPECKAARDLEERGEHEDRDVERHSSIRPIRKSRVPGGPVSSRNSGPPSGSTVMPNRRTGSSDVRPRRLAR
jgi:hypothetical protein